MNKYLLSIICGATCAVGVAAELGSFEEQVIAFNSDFKAYSTEVEPTPDGGMWALCYHPNLQNATSETDFNNVVYEYRLQYWDKDGNQKFPDGGMLVSDYNNISFTMVNNLLGVDNDGNAIVAISDCRNSVGEGISFTGYCISPDGEFLWGADGQPISDPLKPAATAAVMNQVVLDDGSIVFAWASYDDEGNSEVRLQRFSKEGKPQWDSDKVSLLDNQCSYPFLIPSDDNTCILVYAQSASQIIYARKLDFEGSKVWGKDARVYRGGWGSIPIHTLISVTPSGDGGALIAWTDDRYNTDYECPYLSYITPDGKIGFENASDEGDVKLDYEEYTRCFNVTAVPAADGSGFYATWRVTNYGQSMQGLKMQKISRQGELLWEDNGLTIEPLNYNQVSYISLQQTGENESVLFYEKYLSYDSQVCYARRVDADGKAVWSDETIALTAEGQRASGLISKAYPGNEKWLYYWKNEIPGTESSATTSRWMVGHLNADGIYSKSELANVAIDINDEPICFDGTALYANGKTATIVTPSGMVVSQKQLVDGCTNLDLDNGLYIINVDGKQTIKVSISK